MGTGSGWPCGPSQGSPYCLLDKAAKSHHLYENFQRKTVLPGVLGNESTLHAGWWSVKARFPPSSPKPSRSLACPSLKMERWTSAWSAALGCTRPRVRPCHHISAISLCILTTPHQGSGLHAQDPDRLLLSEQRSSRQHQGQSILKQVCMQYQVTQR